MTWHTGPLLAFDLETTGISTETDRIVSAAAIALGGGQDTKPHTWLSDVDGHEIPEAATAVHGISTEQARAHGIPAKEVVEDLVYALGKAATEGTPIVGHNVVYDLTLLDREARRHLGCGLDEAFDLGKLRVIDTIILDRYAAPFRKRVSEKQGPYQMKTSAQTYGLPWDDDAAHGAEYDAIMSARVAYRIGIIAHQRIQERPDWVRALRTQRFSALRGLSIDELHVRQIEWAATQAADYQEWLRTKAPEGKRDPNAVIDGSWPLIPFGGDQ